MSELDLKPSIPTFAYLNSHAPSPGSLLRANKGKPNYFSYFESLLEAFETKATRHSLGSPGTENQDLNASAQSLIEIAKELLLHYGLKSTIHIRNSYLEAFLLLKPLLKTVLSFPIEFIRKLKIKEIYIYANKEQASMNHDLLVFKDECFIFDTSTSEEEVVQKFYSLLFVYFVRAEDQIIDKWASFRAKYNLNYPANSVEVVYEDLEKVFYSLLGMKQSTIMKQKKKKLKKLLVKFCPENLTHKMIGIKNAEKSSQDTRVSFGNSMVSTYYPTETTDSDEVFFLAKTRKIIVASL